MSLIHRQKGFSLTEVMLAVGTLAIGMSFIGGTFLVAVHLSTVATERTIAAVAADEAFAKIQLYGLNPASSLFAVNRQVKFTDTNSIPPEEFAYPSTKSNADKQYYWSALCRPAYSGSANRIVQVTVFISRKIGSDSGIPAPAQVPVSIAAGAGNENKLTINQAFQQSFINSGSKIAANQTGRIYRVVERDAATQNIIILDRAWQEAVTDSVWVIPPAGGGKSPCIAVYQKEIRF
ncbi:MAG: prepilin-type N-terminal cleavage/methylation domain-containing protein [Sedimentisphaerales bacterium]|nr:prepilin-type N-terminal cleavage/methylation domain-containing protein [Sedimentisphaerales bacterium]